MAHYFFDTSALVKRHVIEAGSPWVKSLVRAKAAHTLYTARITAIEVTSAITRRQRTGSLSAAQGGAILGHSNGTSLAGHYGRSRRCGFPKRQG
jgi:uncharacterized protein